MIEAKTVLVLGAGASMDFGYPSGEQLKDRVAAVLARSRTKDLLEKGYGHRYSIKYLIEAFIKDLKQDRVSTIDRFLSKSSDEYKVFGKVAIALTIMDCEEDDKLFSSDNNWYKEFYTIINSNHPGLDKVRMHKLTILTFNYDRSLEQYLHQRFVSDYGSQRENEVISILKGIPIIHIHGKVNPLPWENESEGRTYDQKGFIPKIFDLAKELKSPGENTSDINIARKAIADAEVIYFVGFGYDDINLNNLGIGGIKTNHVFGTCSGVSVHRQGVIQNSFLEKKIQFLSPNVKAYDFIMSHFAPNRFFSNSVKS